MRVEFCLVAVFIAAPTGCSPASDRASSQDSATPSGEAPSGTFNASQDLPPPDDACAHAVTLNARDFAPSGDWIIASAEEAAVLVEARRIEGGVIFRGDGLSHLPEFPCLEDVDILWVQETSLEDLSAFRSLRDVTDNLQIRRNDRLVSLAGLDALESVEFMTVSQNKRLHSVEGIPNLRNVGDLLIIKFAANDSALDGFPPAGGETATLDLSGDFVSLGPLSETHFVGYSVHGPRIASLEGIPKRAVFEQMRLSGGVYTDLGPLAGVEEIASFSLYGTHVRSLTGLESLRLSGRESGDGGIDIQDNLYLESISALSSLESVASPVQLVNNPVLGSLNGLENVRSMRRLYIGACTSLTTLQPLVEGELAMLDSARVTFNDMIPACEVELLCAKTGAEGCDSTGSSSEASELCG